MNGIVIKKALNCNNFPYGFIHGEDNRDYYFDERNLLVGINIDDVSTGTKVEFQPQQNAVDDRFKANEIKIINDVQNTVVTNTQDEPIIKYYAPGYPLHTDVYRAFRDSLIPNSRENVILNKVSKILYISRISKHIMDQSTAYAFALLGATKFLNRFIRGKYEFLLVLSYFRNGDWQQKTLKIEREIRRRRDIIERSPLPNFYVLISNAKKLKDEIDKQKGGTSAAVIPFTFDEILACKCDKELEELFIERFGEYLFENDMLGETSAIDEENLLFGDRGKIADSIENRCLKSTHSGIFGLRRSGKTSVLDATLRRLDRDNIKYVKIESRSELEQLDSWNTALFDISKKIRQTCLGIDQKEDETRIEFEGRLKLNSSEDDYKKRPSACFTEDVKLYLRQQENVFVIAIDEVELITYNTAKTDVWMNVNSYCGFWGALRDSGCSLIISGVNSTINEINSISYNGMQGDNPMYGRIVNCADTAKTYLPSFTDEQTKKMINTLGSYSNIAFSNVYHEINRTFGGQPYPIRQFCSYAFQKIKDKRTLSQIFEFSKPTIDNLIIEFSRSDEGYQLCETILQHLAIYTEEYEMLKNIAVNPDKFRTVSEQKITKIGHLEKYGLLEYDRRTLDITFRIDLIKDFLSSKLNKNTSDMTNDERRQYIQDRVAECEKKLKTFICQNYLFTGKESKGRNSFKSLLSHKNLAINNIANPKPNPDTCEFKDFFNHKKFIFYFSTIRIIIENNWTQFEGAFVNAGITKANFISYMQDLNAGRNDADHYDAEDFSSPETWDIGDTTMQCFISAYSKMNSFFEKNNL
jgi:hypothetical protein